ncbi:MAG: winged helix-turn-helix domain-containing protein [Nitrososphaera sp.]
MKAAEADILSLYPNMAAVAHILETAKRGAGLREGGLQSDEYLSLSQVNDCLSLMQKNDLIKFDMDSKSYRATRKGEAFLRTYQALGEFIDLIDEEIGL